ncbi:MAG: tetratricopeptide repeat protein, partial [Saprospiraceae bacterium]
MNEPQRDVYADNDAAWQRLTRIFDRREKSVVAWIGGNSQEISYKQYHRFRDEYAKKFEHIEVRADQMPGRSVYSHLKRLLAQHSYQNPLFHIRSIPEEGNDLIFEVNFERELLFRKLPASIIFWGNDRSEIAFQRLAPDFWDWLVYRFHFDAVTQPGQESPPDSLQRLPSMGEAWETRAARLRERLQGLAAERDHGGRHTLDYADTALSLGKAVFRLAEIPEARALYDEAIGLFKKEQSDLGRANALKALGDLESRLGNVERARALYDQAIGLFKKEQDDLGRANALQALGDLESRLGNVERARALYDEAIGL